MSNKKRQHYFDQAMQRMFVVDEDEKLWVYDKEKNEYRRQGTDQIAVEGHIYSLESPELKEHQFIIEDTLQALLDNALPAFEKLREDKELTQTERNAVSGFIGFQAVRTPEKLKVSKGLTKRLVQASYEELALQMANKPKAEYEAMMKELSKKESRDLNLPQEEWRRVVEEKRLKTKDDAVDYHRGLMVSSGDEIGKGLSARRWVVLHTKKGQSFVGSDEPVMQLRPGGRFPLKGVGPLAPKVHNIFAYSKDAAIVITDESLPSIEHLRVSTSMLNSMNGQLGHNSRRIVFSHSKELLEAVVARHHLDTVKGHMEFDDVAIRKIAKDLLRG